MTGRVLASRLSVLLSGRFCRKVPSARTEARKFSRAAPGSQLLTGPVDRFGGVTVDLAEVGLPEDISEDAFSRILQGNMLSLKLLTS